MPQRIIVRGVTDAPSINVFLSGDESAITAQAIYKDEFVEVVTNASSKRMNGDPFDARIGMHLAAGRAIRDLGRALLRNGNDLVKMEATRQRMAEEHRRAQDKERKRKGAQIRKQLKAKAKQKDQKKGKSAKKEQKAQTA